MACRVCGRTVGDLRVLQGKVCKALVGAFRCEGQNTSLHCFLS